MLSFACARKFDGPCDASIMARKAKKPAARRPEGEQDPTTSTKRIRASSEKSGHLEPPVYLIMHRGLGENACKSFVAVLRPSKRYFCRTKAALCTGPGDGHQEG